MTTATSVLSACLLGYLMSASAAAGAVTVTGTYGHRTDDESLQMLGGLLCFRPDEASAKRLPRPPRTSSLTWFCFQNSKTAMKQLGINDGPSGRTKRGSRGRAAVRIGRPQRPRHRVRHPLGMRLSAGCWRLPGQPVQEGLLERSVGVAYVFETGGFAGVRRWYGPLTLRSGCAGGALRG